MKNIKITLGDNNDDKKLWYDESFVHQAYYHPIIGNWQLEGKRYAKIPLKKICDSLNESNLKRVKLDDIAWKGKHLYPFLSGENCWCCHNQKRYWEADEKYPGIIVKNAPNPYNNKYRMIDGKHRIQKLLLSGKKTGLYYILDYDYIRQFIIDGDPEILEMLYKKTNNLLSKYL